MINFQAIFRIFLNFSLCKVESDKLIPKFGKL